MASIVDPPTDGKTEAPAQCGELGATIGVPPNLIQIRCQLPVSHATRHHGQTDGWWETWGPGLLPDPWWLVNC